MSEFLFTYVAVAHQISNSEAEQKSFNSAC